MKEWHKGHPPSIGWWPTSAANAPTWLRSKEWVRWWDGKHWSVPVSNGHPARDVNHMAALRTAIPDSRVLWANRPESWPDRSKT